MASSAANSGMSLARLQAILNTKKIIKASESSSIKFTGSGTIADPLKALIKDDYIIALIEANDGGEVTIPSWDDTVAVDGEIVNRSLIFNATYAKPPDINSPVSHTHIRIRPLVKEDETENASFYFSHGGFRNNTKTNEVMIFGWNMGAGGGAAEAGKPGIGESWEQNYQISPTGTGARYVEKHEYYIKPDGTQVRIGSYTIDSDADTIQHYHTVDSFDYRKYIFTGSEFESRPYLIGQGTSNVTSFKWQNILDPTVSVGIDANFAQDVNTSNFVINSGTDKTNQNFTLAGFTGAFLPVSVVIGNSDTEDQITFQKGDTTQIANLSAIPARLSINSVTGTVQIAALNTLVAEYKQTIYNIKTSTTIGSHTTTNYGLDVRVSSGDGAAQFINNQGSGTKAGIEVTAQGAGSLNYATYFQAFGASANRALWIDNTAAGSDNYSIYNNALAKSYLKGQVGINNTTPHASALLDIVATDKGVLFPRMSAAQRDAISPVTDGLMIYNTDTHKFNFYNGSGWEAITSA